MTGREPEFLKNSGPFSLKENGFRRHGKGEFDE